MPSKALGKAREQSYNDQESIQTKRLQSGSLEVCVRLLSEGFGRS